jgi:hypothetical protein
LVTIGHPDKDRNMVIGTEKHTSFIGMKGHFYLYGDHNLDLQKGVVTRCEKFV